ncbi:Co-chaperone Hsc20 [Trametes elegans]|nr:Co-chaperone Hsc20 [Trametes elegans]
MFRIRSLVSLSAHARSALPRHATSRGLHLPRYTTTQIAVNTRRRNHTEASTRTRTCPSCSAPLPTALPVCTSCSYIEPIPKSMSYHEMLGTSYEPNPFVVDVQQLKQQFRAVQAVVHPDRWVSKPPEQQAMAAAMSSRINEALHRLSNPLRRVEYILAREGFGGEETDKLDDMELLMEVMEAREGLANAQSPEEVAEIREENDALRTAAIKLKYLQGIESAAAAWPATLHDH